MSDAASLDIVRGLIAERRPDLAEAARGLSSEMMLDDIGLDSLAVVDLLFELAAQCDADLETALEGLDPPRTLGDLAAIARSFQQGG